jgi:hypothetical protein
MKLPRGIWFETARDRYRVRKYRNGIPHLVYCKTEAQARKALDQLQAALRAEPKVRTGNRLTGAVPAATFAALLKATQKGNL